jgi:hypothetical protein
MVNEFPGNVVDQHDALFMKGNLGLDMESKCCDIISKDHVRLF